MKKCLIVDDSDVVRKVARSIIESLGLDVVEAQDCAEALVSCKSSMPCLMFLDWHLPRDNTLEFLAAFRALPGGKRAKVLYVTTENATGDITRAMAAGASDHMMKPFDREMLSAKVAALMADWRPQRPQLEALRAHAARFGT